LRALSNRAAADRDAIDEVAHYVELTVASLVARGIPPEEARRMAQMEIGNATVLREEVRSQGWESSVEALHADLRYALRRLRAAPAFTAVTLLTLSLGIGGTTAIFSAVNRVLFESLPYPNANRIAMIAEVASSGARNPGTFGMYEGLRERSRSFESMAVLKPWQPTITGTEQSERLHGQRVSASYFHVLGVRPALGRDLLAGDDVRQGPPVVVISDALWRRRFAADASIVGRRVSLDDDLYEIVGVLPRQFENVLAPDAELWAPLQYDMSNQRAWGHHLRTIGRLDAGVSMDQATRDVSAAGRAVLDQQHPVTYDPNTRFAVVSLREELTRAVKPAMLAILAAVIVVLVIACVNVTNLLLARGVERRAEFALRAALGAGGGRLVRQLLTESLVLAILGGAAGMFIAAAGVRALVALSPPGLPRAADIGVDAPMFLFALGITTLIGVSLGVVPALQAVRSDPQRDLQGGSRRTAGRRRTARSALVVAEVALALILLVTSGLLLRSLRHLFAVPIGFDSSHLLTVQVQVSGRRFGADSTTHRFFDQTLHAVRDVPGVTSAAFTSQLPMSGDLDEYGTAFEATVTQPAASYSAYRYAVSPRYLETMGIRLVRGRLLDEGDRADAPRVALISESLARLRFGSESPIGRSVTIGGGPGSAPFMIVGVVGDVRQVSLALVQTEAVYTTATQWRWADNAISLVIRTRGNAEALIPAVRQAIRSVDRDQPIVRVATMDDLVARSAAERRFALTLFEAFAFAALVLAAAGIYGVLATSVAERTREIGVRSALGASQLSILALVARQGMTLALAGSTIGLIGALGASRAISALLFGVSPLDPATYAGVVALMLAVASAATWIPAWRAARVDPATTLRSE
jgi:putative ABC transport system permease protein